MDTNTIIKKGISQYNTLMILSGIVGMVLFKTLLEDYYFEFYPFLIVFFIIIGSFTISIIAKAYEKDNNTFLNTFMALKVIRLVIMVLFCVIYGLTVKENIKSFFVAFTILLVIYQSFETRFSIKLNRFQNEFNQK